MSKIKSSVQDEPADGFTSMIDIVFLLLIFFILQPFKAPEMKLRSELPKDMGSGVSAAPPRPNIKLQIYAPSKNKGAFRINDQEVEGSLIHARLRSEAGDDPTVPVVLAPTMDVHFRYVLKALDECHLAGMEDIKFSGG